MPDNETLQTELDDVRDRLVAVKKTLLQCDAATDALRQQIAELRAENAALRAAPKKDV
jgi:septal ring factor EnvC (AmiA/AmiB activator)